jgi:hypothetical protein
MPSTPTTRSLRKNVTILLAVFIGLAAVGGLVLASSAVSADDPSILTLGLPAIAQWAFAASALVGYVLTSTAAPVSRVSTDPAQLRRIRSVVLRGAVAGLDRDETISAVRLASSSCVTLPLHLLSAAFMGASLVISVFVNARPFAERFDGTASAIVVSLVLVSTAFLIVTSLFVVRQLLRARRFVRDHADLL